MAHARTIDTLGRMRKSGAITPAMFEAAQDFRAQFTIAALDSIPAASLVRTSGGAGAPEPTERQLACRQSVHQAIDALGGLGSPAGDCVWHVVGLQHSLRQWAARCGWSRRSVHVSQAPGILIAALGMLAAHYGYPTPCQKLGACYGAS